MTSTSAPGINNQFGQDWAWGPTGLSPTGQLASGVQAVEQAMVRSLRTPQGAMFWDPDRLTMDLTSLIGQPLGLEDMPGVGSRIQAVAADDERVLSCRVVAQLVPDSLGRAMTVSVAGLSAQGPFALTLSVTAVTVTVLSQT